VAHAEENATVRVLSCSPGDSAESGAVTYVARMRALPGATRMALRIRLFEKVGDEEFERVTTDELGVWRRSEPGAAAFRWTQRVEGLRPGRTYRAIVQYRWDGPNGQEVRSERVRSALCKQPDALPNLRVADVEVRPGDVADTAVYRVKIVNRGEAAARGVGVLLRVDGEVVDEAEIIKLLEPDEVRTVTFDGPVCRDTLRVVVDPKELIVESHEEDNTRSPACL
jgi:CARDB